MKVRDLLFDKDPYEDFIPDSIEDLRGWGGHYSFFRAQIEDVRPKTIVEVGSWKGRSAVAMAEICRDIGLNDTEIICVDTWLGATEFWMNKSDEKRYGSLKIKNGYPQVYDTFLSNVKKRWVQNWITPFPQTSINAARFFLKQGIKADLIYVDASHEYEDVKADLTAWSKVLSPNGVMIGDDYCEYWSGVIKAVDEHASSIGKKVTTIRMNNESGQAPSDYWRII